MMELKSSVNEQLCHIYTQVFSGWVHFNFDEILALSIVLMRFQTM